MQTAVESAWIAASGGLIGVLIGITGTVFVARTAFRATTRSTSAQIEADRDSRVWDKRAAAYSDAIAGVLHRQRERLEQWQAISRGTPRPERELAPVDWPALEGRLLAFASPAVVRHFKASNSRDINAQAAIAVWQDLRSQGEVTAEMTDPQTRRVVHDIVSATFADDGLISVIRSELHADPAPYPEPGQIPTVGALGDADGHAP